MAMSEGYITTEDGVRLFFQKLGSGPRVVVIPNAAYLFDDFRYLAEDRTLISYDLRNRGRSDSVSDALKLKGGIQNDVADLESVRRHFGISLMDVIGHSYLGMVVALYAMKYPVHVNRLVQIGSVQPEIGKQYPAHLTGADATMAEVSAKLVELQKEGPSGDPNEFGKRVWSLMRLLFVVNPSDADKITWSVGHLPNESFVNVMKYYDEYMLPSVMKIKLTPDDFAKVQLPVLVIHGTRDRQAPYGGGRDWALRLPDARLLTVANAAHLPWIEAPDKVFGSIKTFLDGIWPDEAHCVSKALNDEEISGTPMVIHTIRDETEKLGFRMASEPKTGALLRALAAAKPGGSFLELGTGTGIGTAWLLAGMDANSKLVSVDNDPRVQAIAQRHLGHDLRVRFDLIDGAEFLSQSHPQFDLIYADAWPGKFSQLDLALSLLRIGGIYFIDDLLPQPNWPEDHAPKVEALIEDLESRSGFVCTKLAWASGLMLLVKTELGMDL